ncbi:MAG: VanZ family protein [Planctomycetaceae bacterium]
MKNEITHPELRAPWSRICCGLLLIMVTWCLLTPHPPANLHRLQEEALRGDLLIHFTVFGMVTFFVLSLCRPTQIGGGLLFAIMYAIFTEILQSFVPNRSCDSYDLIANFCGVLGGLIFFQAYQKMLHAWGREFLAERFAASIFSQPQYSVRLSFSRQVIGFLRRNRH